jgi:hypothetical protein
MIPPDFQNVIVTPSIIRSPARATAQNHYRQKIWRSMSALKLLR